MSADYFLGGWSGPTIAEVASLQQYLVLQSVCIDFLGWVQNIRAAQARLSIENRNLNGHVACVVLCDNRSSHVLSFKISWWFVSRSEVFEPWRLCRYCASKTRLSGHCPVAVLNSRIVAVAWNCVGIHVMSSCPLAFFLCDRNSNIRLWSIVFHFHEWSAHNLWGLRP